LIVALCCIAGASQAQTPSLQGFSPAAASAQTALEARFDSYLDAARIGARLKDLSARPHHVGSPGDQAVARRIFEEYKACGFEVSIDTFFVLFPTPKTRELTMTGPVSYKAVLAEPALAQDATSGQTSEQLPTYNAWSADGDVSGELVFVGYGLPEDYDQLARRGIDVRGKIVIARYGRSWRGIKPKVAQEHGAIGCIIYSDPKDDGYYQGDVYPEGAFKNAYGVQRGSVMDMPIYPGDPLTPNIGATRDAPRIDRKDAVNLLKIPVLPISYHDAEPLLKSLDGQVAPEDWRGALPFTYHLGPGKTVVHLKLAFNWDIKPIYDIIARVPGSTLPDQWVIRGNHHDAWVNGAGDPLSGQVAMLEEAHAIGELLKTGWRPKRTLVFCSWDGEEPALLGSTEFVEQHARELQRHAVAYINSDGNGRGFFNAEGSHAFEPFLEEVARDVKDPETGVSVLERRRARDIVNADAKQREDLLGKPAFHIGALGSGSDYSPFIQHIGVPSMDLAYGGEDPGGEYHSIYDSYDDYRRFKDPGFVYGVTLAKTAGRAMLRLSEAEVLPFDFTALAKTIKGYEGEVAALADKEREATTVENRLIREGYYHLADDPSHPMQAPGVKSVVPFFNFAPLQNAQVTLDKASSRLEKVLTTHTLSGDTLQVVNAGLYQAEQQLLSDQGLPRRPWYRHSIYAPGFYTGYGVKTLPGIREALEQRNWTEAQQQIDLDAAILERFAGYLGKLADAAGAAQ
jgi:N-acetylated-alpha-linked acidic dipeptidase